MEELKKNGEVDFIKVKVKEYVDLWDESDEAFARAVLTIVRRHGEKN